MSVQYAILGILSYGSHTGYDLKKVMNDSAIMYWSGNNNQIYKALKELKEKGYVNSEVIHQEEGPVKKIYEITKHGREELHHWVRKKEDPEGLKKIFLVQLAWAADLEPEEIEAMADQYQEQVRQQLWMVEEEYRRRKFFPDRNWMEVELWELIYDNLISSWKNELEWTQRLKKRIRERSEER